MIPFRHYKIISAIAICEKKNSPKYAVSSFDLCPSICTVFKPVKYIMTWIIKTNIVSR